MKRTPKNKRIKARNPYVAPSRFRKAGAHQDKRRTLQERAARKDQDHDH